MKRRLLHRGIGFELLEDTRLSETKRWVVVEPGVKDPWNPASQSLVPNRQLPSAISRGGFLFQHTDQSSIVTNGKLPVQERRIYPGTFDGTVDQRLWDRMEFWTCQPPFPMGHAFCPVDQPRIDGSQRNPAACSIGLIGNPDAGLPADIYQPPAIVSKIVENRVGLINN